MKMQNDECRMQNVSVYDGVCIIIENPVGKSNPGAVLRAGCQRTPFWETPVGAILDRPPKIFDFRIFQREIIDIFALRRTDFAIQNLRAGHCPAPTDHITAFPSLFSPQEPSFLWGRFCFLYTKRKVALDFYGKPLYNNGYSVNF